MATMLWKNISLCVSVTEDSMIPKGQRVRIKMGQKVSKHKPKPQKESLMTQTSRIVGQTQVQVTIVMRIKWKKSTLGEKYKSQLIIIVEKQTKESVFLISFLFTAKFSLVYISYWKMHYGNGCNQRKSYAVQVYTFNNQRILTFINKHNFLNFLSQKYIYLKMKSVRFL